MGDIQYEYAVFERRTGTNEVQVGRSWASEEDAREWLGYIVAASKFDRKMTVKKRVVAGWEPCDDSA